MGHWVVVADIKLRGYMRRRLAFLGDIFLVAIAVILAVFVRDNLDYVPGHYTAVLPYLFATLASAFILFSISGNLARAWRFSSLGDYIRLSITCFLIVGCALAWGFAYNRLEGVARSLPILQGLFSVFLLVGARVVRRVYYSNRKQTASRTSSPLLGGHETVLVIGLTRVSDLYVRSVAEFAPLSIRIAGFLDTKIKNAATSVHHSKVLGVPEDVERVVADLRAQGVIVDKIVVAVPFNTLAAETKSALNKIENSSSVKIRVLSEILELETQEDASSKSVHSEFVFSQEELKALQSRPYWIVKRAFDVVVGTLLLLLTAPLMLLVAFVVAFDLGFPVLFAQQRPGRDGVPIDVHKFRTMGASHDETGRRIPDRYRVSALGRFLRRTRLDEFPQLFDIISGDMSFVGPRPLLPIDQAPKHSSRLLIRPGLTGWAQVNGGRYVSANDKAAMDVWYAKNASFLLDLKIVLRTALTLIRGEKKDARAIARAWQDLRPNGLSDPELKAAITPPSVGRVA